MAQIGYTHVTLVVDPEFGQLAKTQAELGPLWVIQSLQNMTAVKEIWAAGKSRYADSPTYFDAVPGRSLEDSAIDFIGTVDEHHPGWLTFEIIGVKPSANLLNALRECAAGSMQETPTGLIFARYVKSN